MSKVINLEIVDILDGIVVLETESGFEVEMDSDSLPLNIKVGQTIKCAMTLNTNTQYKEEYILTEEQTKKLTSNKIPMY